MLAVFNLRAFGIIKSNNINLYLVQKVFGNLAYFFMVNGGETAMG